jgi:hypothetical protein
MSFKIIKNWIDSCMLERTILSNIGRDLKKSTKENMKDLFILKM